MGLKNYKSNLDLVQGLNPVGDMETQSGPQFDLGPSSILQVNSLPQIPENSPFQDLDGQPGPQFDLGPNSTLQQDSLLQIPINNLGYSDLNGLPGPQFDNGPEQGGFNLVDTIHESSLTYPYSYQHGNAFAIAPNSILDLNGGVSLNYYTWGGTTDAPFDTVGAPSSTGDHMIDLLTNSVTSTNTNQIYNPSPNSSPYQDINGTQGPTFDNGVGSTLHQDSLLDYYEYNHGGGGNPFNNSQEQTGPSSLDLDGIDGGQGPFDNGTNSTLHTDSLLSMYEYNHGGGYNNFGNS